MNKVFVFLLACLFACEAQQTILPASTGISGLLTGEDGTPIVGATLLMRRTRTLVLLPERQQTDWQTTTGSGGSLALTPCPRVNTRFVHRRNPALG